MESSRVEGFGRKVHGFPLVPLVPGLDLIRFWEQLGV